MAKRKMQLELEEYPLEEEKGNGLGISPQEAVYQSVVDCVKDKDMEVLKLKMRKLRALGSYKDSEQLLAECEKKMRAAKRKLRWKKFGRILSWVIDIALFMLLVVIVVYVIQRKKYGM